MKRTTRRIGPAVLLAALLGATASPAQQAAKTTPRAIQILRVESDEVKLPPEFQMALYENLIEQVAKTKQFERIYREGETVAAGADLLTLRGTVRGFKKGSERARQVTTVAGATSIQVHVQVLDRTGRVLLERDVEGKVRFFGDNLRATYDFAKGVAKLLREGL